MVLYGMGKPSSQPLGRGLCSQGLSLGECPHHSSIWCQKPAPYWHFAQAARYGGFWGWMGFGDEE